MRASSASRRSRACNPHPMDKMLIPGCTYCQPQIASVGLTEQAAKDKKRDIRVGRFPFIGNGKAIALGEDQGLIKVIFDKKTGQLARRAHGRRRSHRTHPGLCRRDESGDDGRRIDAHHLPASDSFGDDEGSGARCLWPRPEHVTCSSMRCRQVASTHDMRRAIYIDDTLRQRTGHTIPDDRSALGLPQSRSRETQLRLIAVPN